MSFANFVFYPLVIGIVQEMPNPHQQKLKFGEKNDIITSTTETPNGEISDVLLLSLIHI